MQPERTVSDGLVWQESPFLCYLKGALNFL